MHHEQASSWMRRDLAAQCEVRTYRELADNATRLWATAQHQVENLRSAREHGVVARPIDRCYNNGMSILRRKPRQRIPVRKTLSEWGITLELHPKDLRGRTGRHHMIRVSPNKEAPGINVSIQAQTMLAGAHLDEQELDMLIKGLRDALEASKAIAASRESQEAGQGG
jgi:hypothetical protein